MEYLVVFVSYPSGVGLRTFIISYIYKNNLPLVSNIFTMLMYADDPTLYCNVHINVTDDLLNCELSKICDWLSANKLALNVSKTTYMVHQLRILIKSI